jgi:hypothetical protein
VLEEYLGELAYQSFAEPPGLLPAGSCLLVPVSPTRFNTKSL